MACRFGVHEALECAFNISGHRDVNSAVGVVPDNGESDIAGAGPVC